MNCTKPDHSENITVRTQSRVACNERYAYTTKLVFPTKGYREGACVNFAIILTMRTCCEVVNCTIPAVKLALH